MTAGDVAVTVNGEPRRVPADTSVARLVEELALRTDRCAVEVNREVVPRSSHGTRVLRDGDAVEVVTFVGGG